MLPKIREPAEETPLRKEALRQSETKFRTLAETIASAIFIAGGSGCIIVNHAAEVITGYKREELCQRISGILSIPIHKNQS